MILGRPIRVQESNATSATYAAANIGGTIGGVIGGLVGGIAIGVVTMVIINKSICAPNKENCRKRKETEGKGRTSTIKQ